MLYMVRKTFILVSILWIGLFQTTAISQAEIQIEVSENGDNSSNNVSLDQNNSTTTSQSNDTSNSNTLDQVSNTGENSIEDTTGGYSSISTGNVEQTTKISNEINNSTVVVDPCCNGNQSITVLGNGSGSVNSVDTTSITSTVVNITQNATITNTVNGIANTGNNTISNSSGNASIVTGNIYGNILLQNSANFSYESVGAGNQDVGILIKNNGDESINSVRVNEDTQVLINRYNLAVINSSLYVDFNTGGNAISGILGDAYIKTGDISSVISITNGPLNIGKTIVDCCGDPVVPPPPPPNVGGENPKTPPDNNHGNGGNGNSGTNGGSEGGGSSSGNGVHIASVLANMLPSTGVSGNTSWYWTIIYLIMFLSGLYVRLRAGRSPNKLAKFSVN